MYTVITFYVVGYFISLWWNYRQWDEWAVSLCFLEAFVFAFAGVFVALLLPMNYVTTTWRTEIVTLKDNNGVSGSFFLGSGVIEGQMRYVYYQKNNDSTYQMQQVDYYKARIKYTEGSPCIIITDIRTDESFYNKWAFDFDDYIKQTYVFEVPKGSIKNAYELDAQ